MVKKKKRTLVVAMNTCYDFFKYIFLLQLISCHYCIQSNIINNSSTITTSVDTNIPFHATAINDGSWVCKQGFFKTKPQNPLLATCRRCSLVSIDDCPANSFFIECTPLHDAGCQICPTPTNNNNLLPHAWTYTPEKHDCVTMQCKNGFFNDSNSITCLPCPIGSYCLSGAQIQCGENLTTLSQEESSPLACAPTHRDAAWQIQITFYFSLQVSDSTYVFSYCPQIKDLVLEWLLFGKLIECSGSKKEDVSLDGEINCIIIIARRFTTDYIQWLYKEIVSRSMQLMAFTRQCIAINDKDKITGWDARIQSMEPETVYYFFPSNRNTTMQMINSSTSDVNSLVMMTVPPAEYPQITSKMSSLWGSFGHDIALFTLSITLFIFSLCVSIFFLLTGIILRYRRNITSTKRRVASV